MSLRTTKAAVGAANIKKLVAATVFVTLFLALPAAVLALYVEMFGNRPIAKQRDWADGIVDVVNLKSRVFQYDVNGNEHFFYRGDADALKEALHKFAAIRDEPRQLILMPGTGNTYAQIAKKDVDFDWQLHVPGGIFKFRYKDMHPTMKVYVSVLKPRPLPNPQKVDQWLTDLANDSFATRERARQQLQQMGNDAKPHLRAALKANLTLEARLRVRALLDRLRGFDVTDFEVPPGITAISVDELLALHVRALQEGGRDDRSWAVGQLSNLSPYSDRVVPAMTAALKGDEDPYIRRLAAIYLADIGVQAKSALPALRERLTDPDANVRTACESAIAKLEILKSQPVDEEQINRKRAILQEINEFKKAAGSK